MKTIRVVDSHTGGEPTRVVVEGGPDLGHLPLAGRLALFRERFDHYRTAIVGEPRGSAHLVGALLGEPHDPACVCGVIFFDNAGYLGMCGHGTIGVVATLAHLGRLGTGRHGLDTPVGVVMVERHEDGRVTVDNVPSFRHAAGVEVEVPGHGPVRGDVAWGGNWFFLVEEHGLQISRDRVEELTDFAWRARQALAAAGVRGADGAEVDHVELFAPSPGPGLDSRSFVLCPGKAYDRSPCGTGTSAKLACLFADGRLAPGQVWRQQSVTGSVFEGRIEVDPEHPGRVRPSITGTAHVTGEATLLLDERDPLCWGLGRHVWPNTS
ncbi:MAG TPA: proline racemase family protein [Vicinamibacteria bacterium]|nr:proline racemase family protein [Vicinamibacteria bacterium]